ncbi:MAG: division/cell wall cluster transcriptional repressor MraZ [Actinomycetota bacterium]
MLTGEFHHSLDAKGRVFVPARWRDELQEGVFVTAGLEKCLFLMSRPHFESRAAQLETVSMNQKVQRDHNRLFFSTASQEQIDRSGRITVPASLREYAGLSKDVILIGVSTRAEVWDAAAWEQYKRGIESDYEQIAERLDTSSPARKE